MSRNVISASTLSAAVAIALGMHALPSCADEMSADAS